MGPGSDAPIRAQAKDTRGDTACSEWWAESGLSPRPQWRTISAQKTGVTVTQLALLPEDQYAEEHVSQLPDRSECRGGYRPCPMVSCRYHLLLHVTEYGALTRPYARTLSVAKSSVATVERWIDAAARYVEVMPETCALDMADRGESSMVVIGEILGITRERVRQVAESAFARREVREWADGVRGIVEGDE